MILPYEPGLRDLVLRRKIHGSKKIRENKKMNGKAIAKGMTVGAAVGLACYAFSAASAFKKHSIMKNAEKTLKAAGGLIDDLTSALK